MYAPDHAAYPPQPLLAQHLSSLLCCLDPHLRLLQSKLLTPMGQPELFSTVLTDETSSALLTVMSSDLVSSIDSGIGCAHACESNLVIWLFVVAVQTGMRISLLNALTIFCLN